MSRKRILVFIDWYLPGYKAGGPIQSVANIVSHLKDEFDFSIITSDTDLNEVQPYSTVKSDEWNVLADGTRVYYASALQLNYKMLQQLILSQQPDVIYLNSFFSKYFTVFPLLIAKRNKFKGKIIVAPRGMLGSGALQLKAAKKNIYIAVAKLTGLYKNVTWHASTDVESDEIKEVFGNAVKVVVAINLSRNRSIVPVHRVKETNMLKVAFLSRISPKKNLIAVHRYLEKLADSCAVQFDFYGPVDDQVYFQQCVNKFESLPGTVKVQYGGAIEQAQITDCLSRYHVTILPTFNENFGHSIVDSWVAGCPVIISDQTPWRNLEVNKCGWDVPLNDDEAFVTVLKRCCEMDQQEYDQWSAAAYQYGENVIRNPEAVNQNKRLFNADHKN